MELKSDLLLRCLLYHTGSLHLITLIGTGISVTKQCSCLVKHHITALLSNGSLDSHGCSLGQDHAIIRPVPHTFPTMVASASTLPMPHLCPFSHLKVCCLFSRLKFITFFFALLMRHTQPRQLLALCGSHVRLPQCHSLSPQETSDNLGTDRGCLNWAYISSRRKKIGKVS